MTPIWLTSYHTITFQTSINLTHFAVFVFWRIKVIVWCITAVNFTGTFSFALDTRGKGTFVAFFSLWVIKKIILSTTGCWFASLRCSAIRTALKAAELALESYRVVKRVFVDLTAINLTIQICTRDTLSILIIEVIVFFLVAKLAVG